MPLPVGLRARDPASAVRASTFVVVAAALVMGWSAFLDSTADLVSQVGIWSVVLLLLGAAFLCRSVDPAGLDARGLLLLIPASGALAVNAMNLLTSDTSAAGQVFLVLPVLVAATQLHAAGAVLVTGIGVLGNAVVQPLLQPLLEGLPDIVFVGAAMITVTVVLVRAENRKDLLVAALKAQASLDPLTGLATRRVVDDALAMALHTRSGGAALLLVDIDGFKQVNDGYGHLVGDDALVHLASVLRDCIRTTDRVLGRMEGDELAVFLPGCSQAVAEERAAQLVAAVRDAPLAVPGKDALTLTISIGVAHAPSHAGQVRELYAAADLALYAAKRAGRNRFAVALS